MAGPPAVTVPPGGNTVSQFPPEGVLVPEENVSGEVFRLCTSTACDEGDSPPAAATKIIPVGCTIGPTWLPGGNRFNTTDTNCGLLFAPGEVTFTDP